MTTGERFDKMLKDLNLSKNAFANKLGVSSTVINGIVGDTNNPGHKVLSAIKQHFPQYNTDWLLNGEGAMKSSISAAQDESNYLITHLTNLEQQFRELNEQMRNQLAMKDKQIDGLQRTVDVLLGKSEDVMHLTAARVMPLYSESEAQA